LDEAQRGNVFIMRKSSQLLLSMINRILTYSDIESGQQSLAKTNFALKDLIERLSESCAEEARGAGLDFVSERSGTLPEQVQGDEVKLNEALANLLGNAVKFTPEGRVGFAVEGSVEESRATVRFKVSDTGVGIAKAERDRIFRAFEQGDASLTRQFEGVGLGLAISSRLIEMMGSKLEMKSEKGEGSSFWFSVTFELPR